MITVLLILVLLIWGLVVFRQIARKGFLVLLIWLVVGPFVTKAVRSPGENPFFQTQAASDGGDLDLQERMAEFKRQVKNREVYFKSEASIRLDEVAEPTRLLFAAFALV